MMTTTRATATKAPSADEQYQAALAAVTADEFRNAPAAQKQDALWRFVSQLPYDTLPSAKISNSKTMRGLRKRSFLRKAWDDDDVRSPRTKAFHTYGTVAKMRFVADGEHDFTGIFASGGVGLVRASLAVGMPNYSPAAAIKVLLDGPHPSENLLLHQSLDKQASRDFFERAPTNHTLEPGAFPNTWSLPLLRFWLSPISDPIELQPVDHLAKVTSDGTPVEQAHAPEQVYLYGAEEARNDPASTDDFRTILERIPVGTPLYKMYGTPRHDAKPIYIGSVIAESGFVTSEFGDRILAFSHASGSAPSGSAAACPV